MLRTALRPRWLGLFALLVVVVGAFVWLGLWQFNVAQDEDRIQQLQEQAAQPVQPLSEVVEPQQQFPADGAGVPVRTTGRYDAGGQVLVPDRLLEGARGYWVVTPLVVGDTGARLPVMRGFVQDPDQAAAPMPAETVTVTGTLAPSESPAPAADLPPGQIGAVDLSVLVNTWPGDIYNAFIFRTGEQPEVTASGGSIAAVPPPALVRSEINWGNAGYALQWWTFAAFAVYIWWRMVRDDHQRSTDGGHVRAGAGPPTTQDRATHDPTTLPERSETLHV